MDPSLHVTATLTPPAEERPAASRIAPFIWSLNASVHCDGSPDSVNEPTIVLGTDGGAGEADGGGAGEADGGGDGDADGGGDGDADGGGDGEADGGGDGEADGGGDGEADGGGDGEADGGVDGGEGDVSGGK